MRSETPTQREQQSVQTRQAILTVSLELFVRKGFAGTTIRDIAKAARISPGLMFHYFPSKDALLQEHVSIIAKGIDETAHTLRTSKTPLPTFHRIAERTVESLEDTYARNLFLLANQVLSFDSIPLAAKRVVSRSKSIDASAALIAVGQRRGEIRKGDSRALAVAFWGAMQGIAEILTWNADAPLPSAKHIVSILTG